MRSSWLSSAAVLAAPSSAAQVALVELADQRGVDRGEAAELGVHRAQQGEQLLAGVAGYRCGQQVVDRAAERRRELFAVRPHTSSIVHTFETRKG